MHLLTRGANVSRANSFHCLALEFHFGSPPQSKLVFVVQSSAPDSLCHLTNSTFKW